MSKKDKRPSFSVSKKNCRLRCLEEKQSLNFSALLREKNNTNMSSTYRLQKTDYYRYLLQTQIFVLIVCIKLMRTFRQRKNMNLFQTSIFLVKKEKFVIIVYGKKTISDVYINFVHNSFIPQTYKTGLIKSLLFQCFRLCSDSVIFHHEINILKSNYPLEQLYI